ncbi:hypothetical protein GCM10010435_04540 [Winogradskya consettensis]|uniref:Uncharacterized protein n=1 Tax=Winogradskya consettensis TaxID=113560 RepID=A0A919SWB9_9ACTN|nr:hypothetical protein [Actinoplanes consettensis]GIM79687.1 hypothetical protein Aco04nite_66830 [Actinoplanes consettensis]
MIVIKGAAAALALVLLTAAPAHAAVNNPPTISDVKLYDQNACAAQDAPTVIPGAGSVYLSAEVSDPDTYSPQARFAIWPVDHPDQRQVVVGSVSGYSGPARKEWRPSDFAHGTVLAFQAQATDGTNDTAWSAPCFMRVDAVAPARGPVVSSAEYPADGSFHNGVGKPGTFRFDAEGDPDVVAYVWRSSSTPQTVLPAPTPGAPVTIEYTPTRDGIISLYVTALDAAKNRSPETSYTFAVREIRPAIALDVAGVGLPSTLRLSTGATTVTSFGYRVGDAAEIRVPAVAEGTNQVAAEVPLTVTAKGAVTLTARSFEGDAPLSQATKTFTVSDAPRVTSDDLFWPGTGGVAGRESTLTLTPRNADVATYRFTAGSEPARDVPAGPDGTAVVRWTPPTPGTVAVTVTSLTTAGTVSDETHVNATVLDPRPTIGVDNAGSWPPADGIGRPLAITLHSPAPGIASYSYHFNDGPELTVPFDGGGASITVIPDHAGANTIRARTHFSDGTTSAERTLTFQVSDAPTITSPDYPEGTEAGAPGIAGTFTFHPAQPDVQSYTYSYEYGDDQTVDAAPDGTATIVITPDSEGWKTLRVTSHTADDTASDPREYNFTVATGASITDKARQ